MVSLGAMSARKNMNSSDRTRRCGRRAFTLVEIMVVTAVIGVLSTIAVPGMMKTRQEAFKNICINNLRQLQSAKEQAALANRWDAGDGPDTIGPLRYGNTISAYLKGGALPWCPTGARYSYNALNENPTCASGIVSHAYPSAP